MRGRALAWGLIVYGILGLVLVIGGALIGLQAAGRVERLVSAADGALVAAARSTRAAADSFSSVDGSLATAQESADQAASLADEASGTLASLAASMRLSFFGTQPLLPLASEFETSAEQAAELAETLGTMGGSLDVTRGDATAIGIELESLSRELEVLRGADPQAGGSPPLSFFVALLLAWLAVPAVGAILFGMTLLRRAPAAPAA
jgi:hypothetical protein